ncbi:outer membrane protein assembly factor BamE domain-containing protein [Marinospirillum insulare]|uniref:Outer membrane protein assembly factor BamE domain-containing protein n=1 Tax=Marinospirillum insulare TaxID=217169 RepID=A0ABQ5ZVI1_9GAMM|nr:outer membrane protein assembly factor BamE [Marinospirillum insulare]GLR63308.1 hypothetical protein GCM10007878_07430 [Marinospirillum insulare]
MKAIKTTLFAFVVAGFLAGCATVGQPYAEHKVADLVIGETSKSDIQAMFGNPWRTGSESGQQTWTYGHYRYSAFSDAQTSDLVIRYNKEGKVASYTYNRTTADPKQENTNQAGP